MAYYIDYAGLTKREKMDKALKDIEDHTGFDATYFHSIYITLLNEGFSEKRASGHIAAMVEMFQGITGAPLHQLTLFLRAKHRYYRDV